MAAKFFTGLPIDGPDPECVQGHGTHALARDRDVPRPSGDHSRRGPVPLTLTTRPRVPDVAAPQRPDVAGSAAPQRPCTESPV
jgi:hypothetical protein